MVRGVYTVLCGVAASTAVLKYACNSVAGIYRFIGQPIEQPGAGGAYNTGLFCKYRGRREERQGTLHVTLLWCVYVWYKMHIFITLQTLHGSLLFFQD